MIFNTHYSSKATKDLTGRIYRTLGMKNTKRTIKMIRKMMKLIPTGKKVVIEATADRCSFEVVNNTMNPFVEGVTDLVTGCDKVFINDKYQVFSFPIVAQRADQEKRKDDHRVLRRQRAFSSSVQQSFAQVRSVS